MGIKNGAVYISPIVGGMEICDLKLFFKSWKKVRPGFPFWDQNVKELPPCPNFCTFRSKPFVVLRKRPDSQVCILDGKAPLDKAP